MGPTAADQRVAQADEAFVVGHAGTMERGAVAVEPVLMAALVDRASHHGDPAMPQREQVFGGIAGSRPVSRRDGGEPLVPGAHRVDEDHGHL